MGQDGKDAPMRYAVWLLRLGFAAWLIPAGINHFWPLFPQPPGNVPVSQDVLAALVDSGLFNLVKAVEVFAGLALLVGWRVPLALVMLLPVSFNVWYWDTALQGWHSVSAPYGWAVLGANVLLLLAWWPCYKPLFSATAKSPPWVRPATLLLGAWMALAAADRLFTHMLPPPSATEPLAAQLLGALDRAGLVRIAFAVLLVSGAFLLAGRLVPLALAAMLPVNVGMLHWALLLEQDPLWATLGLLAVALNGGLLLAHLPACRAMLQARPPTLTERPGARYENTYANPFGGISWRHFGLALLPLLGAAVFFHHHLPPIYAQWNLMVLAVPMVLLLLKLAQPVRNRR